jgi:hypothetical protein
MSRQEQHDRLSPAEKAEVFKSAYANVQQFIESKNYLAANVLAFALLEDRIHAAWVGCKMAKNKTPKPTIREVNRNRFADTIRDLKELGAIDDSLAQALHSAAHERNRQTHEMIWRLQSFTKKSAENCVRLARKLDRQHKKFKALQSGAVVADTLKDRSII